MVIGKKYKGKIEPTEKIIISLHFKQCFYFTVQNVVC